MRCQYSTFPLVNPVSPPLFSRFSVHVVDVYEPPADTPADHYDAPKSSAYPASGRPPSPSFLSRPLLRHQQGHCSRQLQHPSIPPRAD